ncbi:MAG: hypothetical protein EAZ55_00330 [Cytophagales bacterium]|nr:MAG: hypothetical protein EAZ55_00330 [Cytophagales bacterium]
MNELLLIIYLLINLNGFDMCEQEKSEYDPFLHLLPKDLRIKAKELAIFRKAHYHKEPAQLNSKSDDGHVVSYLDTTDSREYLQEYIDSGKWKHYEAKAYLDSYYYDAKKKRHYFLIIIHYAGRHTQFGGGYYTTDPKNGKIVDKKLKFIAERYSSCLIKIARKAFEEMIAERAITPYKYPKEDTYVLNVIDKTMIMTWEDHEEHWRRENDIK